MSGIRQATSRDRAGLGYGPPKTYEDLRAVLASGTIRLPKRLRQVAIFLSQHAQPIAGSAVMVAREGSRPMLIEVQALTDESQGMNARRVAVGLDGNRLALLLAVLHRHGGISSAGRDVFPGHRAAGPSRLADAVAWCRMAARRLAVDELRVQIIGDRELAGDLFRAARLLAA